MWGSIWCQLSTADLTLVNLMFADTCLTSFFCWQVIFNELTDLKTNESQDEQDAMSSTFWGLRDCLLNRGRRGLFFINVKITGLLFPR